MPANENKQRIDEILQSVSDELSRGLEDKLAAIFGDKTHSHIKDLAKGPLDTDADGRILWEPNLTFKTVNKFWRELYQNNVPYVARSYLGELLSMRHLLAHPTREFTVEQVGRVESTADLLLKSFGSSVRITQTLNEVHENREQAQFDAVSRSASGLRSWRNVAVPHPDVYTGEHEQAVFAADLSQVHKGESVEEYQEPKEFFERTYLTGGLSDLLHGALKRVATGKGDPIIQLQTNFGGGKTHSLLALYHLFGGESGDRLMGVKEIMEKVGAAKLPQAKRAVFVGTQRGPAEIDSKADGTKIHTIWGDIAWQLGGAEGYEMVKASDENGSAPGAAKLTQIFDKFGPTVILMDEWVAYARQLTSGKYTYGGSLETNISFAQNLTEAVKASKKSLLVVSLPQSDMELGGEGGVAALTQLQKVMGRIDTTWKAATPIESFEIIKRRLFQPIDDEERESDRDETIKKFINMYRKNPQDFPSDTTENEYKKRMEAAYPVHPELFDSLYKTWGSLETFQKTRGVLRLMAMVIHHLWKKQNQNALIMPGDVPIDVVENELKRATSNSGWRAVIENDIDGEQATAPNIDKGSARFGQIRAAQRIAHAIFLGSAPLEKSAKGMETKQINLGVIEPIERKQNISVYGDALRQLGEQAKYIHVENDKYRFSTSPNLTRTAQDLADKMNEQQINNAIVKFLAQAKKNEYFEAIHTAPKANEDISDEMATRLVILGPEHSYDKNDPGVLESTIYDFLDNKGNAQRHYKNTLVFVAANKNSLKNLKANVAKFLAWEKIVESEEVFELTPSLKKQAKANKDANYEIVKSSTSAVWEWILYPHQPVAKTEIFSIGQIKASGNEDIAQKVGKKMAEEQIIIRELTSFGVKSSLQKFDAFLQKPHITTKEMMRVFASYYYLPKLKSQKALIDGIKNEIDIVRMKSRRDSPFFVYAEGYDEENSRYHLISADADIIPVINDDSVLVDAKIAQAQIEKEMRENIDAEAAAQENDSGTVAPGAQSTVSGQAQEQGQESNKSAQSINKFIGSVELDPKRIVKDADKIATEIITHLTSLKGARATITMEMQISTEENIDDNTRRTVRENANTLNFKHSQFE